MKNQIILIGGNNDDTQEIRKTFEIYDVSKNQFIEFPKTSHEHFYYPGMVIENNNLIHVIGNNGYWNNEVGGE